jgi:hypothetical protein
MPYSITPVPVSISGIDLSPISQAFFASDIIAAVLSVVVVMAAIYMSVMGARIILDLIRGTDNVKVFDFQHPVQGLRRNFQEAAFERRYRSEKQRKEYATWKKRKGY